MKPREWITDGVQIYEASEMYLEIAKTCWSEPPIYVIEKSAFNKAIEALNRIVGMTEIWIDEHGQRRNEEIYASRIARDVLKEIAQDTLSCTSESK